MMMYKNDTLKYLNEAELVKYLIHVFYTFIFQIQCNDDIVDHSPHPEI